MKEFRIDINHSPEVRVQNIAAVQNKDISIVLYGSDADGDSLTYMIISEPMHGG